MPSSNQPQYLVAKKNPRVRKFPSLATERLFLRQTTSADMTDIFDLYNDPEVNRFSNLGPFQNLADVENRVLKQHQFLFDSAMGFYWGITLRDSDKIIGTCGFHGTEWLHASTKIGFDLAKSYWGRGIMAEALSAILQWIIQFHRINRIQAETDPNNHRSIATLRRLGFSEEGLLRQSGYWRGEFHDARCFSLLKSDWLSNASNSGGKHFFAPPTKR